MINQYLTYLLEIIDQHGWAVQSVGGGDGPDEAPFSYTVGLTALGHPEFVITGLPPDVAQSILNYCAEEVRNGRTFDAGSLTSDATGTAPTVAFIEMIDPASQLFMAVDIYGVIEALQIVWRDPEGHLPWDDGYWDKPHAQPLWGVPPDSFDQPAAP